MKRKSSTSRPRIGITMDSHDDEKRGAYHLNFDYAKAVELAGGLPLAIPYKTDHGLIPQYLAALDGILFTGGNDLDPAAYGQKWHPKAVAIDSDRQAFEAALLAEVERRRAPMLAICLGCQALNVYRGGSLHQFIPDLKGKREHRKVGGVLAKHAVKIEPDSAIGRAIGKKEIIANSYHKQAVDRVGKGLRVTALSEDGIVEGLEDPSFPLMAAVQWHPERLAEGDGDHLAPFRLLVERAGEYRAPPSGAKIRT